VDNSRSKLGLVAALIGLAFAVALGVIRFVGEKSPVHEAEWWLGDLALAAVVAAPALLALQAAMGRRVLFLPAGVISIVLSVTFLSGAGLPLLIPGILYLIAFARGRGPEALSAAAVALPIALTIAAFGLLLVGSYRIVCWQEVTYSDGRTELSRDRDAERASTPGRIVGSSGPPSADVKSESSGCTEGAIDPARSLLGLAAVGGAVFGGRLFA
jgi:hypothetical protein